MGWSLYIIKCGDGTLYTGITTDLARRIAEHGTEKGARYTKGRGPFTLVYTEICEDRAQASKREMEIKALSRQEKYMLIQTKKD